MLQRLHTIAIRPELSILFILEAMTIMPVIIIGHQKKTQPGKYDDLHANRIKRLSMQKLQQASYTMSTTDMSDYGHTIYQAVVLRNASNCTHTRKDCGSLKCDAFCSQV